jgi:hypothetical protein
LPEWVEAPVCQYLLGLGWKWEMAFETALVSRSVEGKEVEVEIEQSLAEQKWLVTGLLLMRVEQV